MEVLNGVIEIKARCNEAFRYHWKCERTKTVMLAFADDLMLFSNADASSVHLLHDCLEEFQGVSGLSVNKNKSEFFVCSTDDSLIRELLDIIGFKLGKLPVKYLGVPLITSRLSVVDCKALIDRVRQRINSWTNKLLSLGGRLQLVRSILSSIHLFWASIFIIPKSILKLMEGYIRHFLWHGSITGGTTAKVAWEQVCKPQSEGGLGIHNLQNSNKALISHLLWKIITKDHKSIWVS
ncbi:hypothetical protein Nepgr_018818 [Nepenthes gracilis]|uniref:Reverse transcriptase domain-containing protein n=1 Tax=Nepenthes gracilis TaxID=150966 RepID=A0AAD3XTH3_NEPGR|nr:hypothetical protein Nepgr_018818 [Nepenthes gracilis]